jgi:hypothetical protein
MTRNEWLATAFQTLPKPLQPPKIQKPTDSASGFTQRVSKEDSGPKTEGRINHRYEGHTVVVKHDLGNKDGQGYILEAYFQRNGDPTHRPQAKDEGQQKTQQHPQSVQQKGWR